MMKSLMTLLVAAVLIAGLSGCAAHTASGTTKTKCPACGHEFDVKHQP
ncbi:MAG: hypothetical protein RQ723_04285 [Desulfuromonadales bacterium]|nr:hypothetical protein [Desulfuromonadales bacterium]